MLGLRLEPALANQLDAFARQTKRTRSSIARDAVREYLDRHSIEAEFQRQVAVLNSRRSDEDEAWQAAQADAFLRGLDEEDGGYDWGPAGPPV